MTANSLNLISFHHASSLREAAHQPISLMGANGVMHSVPCVMDAVDKLEEAKLDLGDRFEATVCSTGPALTHEFSIVANSRPDEIDSLGKEGTEVGALSKERLAEQIVSGFRKDAFNMVHVRAHGHAHEDVMGMPTEEFVAGLHLAAQRLGRPLPAVLLESCLMSSLDVIASMAGSVQTVIASQEVLEANALPHRELFRSALGEDMSPRMVAQRMTSTAQELGHADTLTAFDVQALTKVLQTVEKLKPELDRQDLDDKVRRTIRQSSRFPHRNVETQYRKRLDLRDLGQVLRAVVEHSDSPEASSLAKEAQHGLELATLGRARGKAYESLSGLSVRTTSVTDQAGWKFADLLPWV